MSRRTYIYWAVPLFTLLGCGATFTHMLGSSMALMLGVLLALPAWGLVWTRLYATGRLRPEFAVLSVLPQLCYFLLMYTGQTGAEGAFASPMWQNIYFLMSLAAMAVQMVSLLPGPQEEKRRLSQDPLFIFLTMLIVANGFFSWVQYASAIFPIN